MGDSVSAPVIAGLAVGIALVTFFSVMIKPDSALSDKELVSKYSKVPEVSYFLDKYPDAKTEVDRNPVEEYLTVSFTIERHLAPSSVFYSGNHTLGVNVYAKPNHLSLAIFCGMGGMTGEWGLSGMDMIDEAEKECFQTTTREEAQQGANPEGLVEVIAVDFSPSLKEQDIVVMKGQTVKIPVMIESGKDTEKVLSLSIISRSDVPDSSELELSLDNGRIVLSKDDIAQGKAQDNGFGRLLRDAGFLTISASSTAKAGTYEYGLEASSEGDGGDGMGAGQAFRVTVIG